MGKMFTAISEDHGQFIRKQHIFFVGTAPLAEEGNVSLSPKGYDSLRLLSPNRVAYLDLTGSGNETSAHLMENGRITVMFCAFEGQPNIIRLYGTGKVILPGSQAWEELYPQFTPLPGARQIIDIAVDKVQTSCGFSVPFMSYEGERDTLQRWAGQKDEEQLTAYRLQKNTKSINGMPTPIGVQLGAE
ncbi:hypothetical protein FHS18_002897 [Paenibacillus phyllosphaerae]|uniref:Pyridoxamine 5'-phosphate oxidase N-terminal domain-containing protein n=1 Tax=Paenibacillus phyllosphaerae TaxID=274593 RepID=A0A7W5FN17_9BACL|nr:pyridoxamine 5'-phosphate oxidase family protein [Paenibacillus phyllosphaerae]MBB3110830.1 hypothetical protein [Paenibacillus phyllosphaerae]